MCVCFVCVYVIGRSPLLDPIRYIHTHVHTVRACVSACVCVCACVCLCVCMCECVCFCVIGATEAGVMNDIWIRDNNLYIISGVIMVPGV